MTEELSKKFKVLGFIMTCFMITYHARSMEFATKGKLDEFCTLFLNAFFEKIGFVVMAYFFCVTGYLLMLNLNKTSYFSKVKRRVSSLLIPYVVWQLIFTPIFVLSGRLEFDIKEFFLSLFALKGWTADGALWYVYAVFLLAIITPLLFLFTNNNYIAFLEILFIAFGLPIIALYYEPLATVLAWGRIVNIKRYILYYLIGSWYGYYDPTRKRIMPICVTLITAFVLDGVFDIYDVSFNNIAVGIMTVLLVLFAEMSFDNVNKNHFIFSSPFLIYAIHVPVIQFFKQYLVDAIKNMELYSSISILIVQICSVICIVIVGLILSELTRRHIPLVHGVLCGNR